MRRTSILLASLASIAIPAFAQTPPAEVQIRVEQLAPGVAVLFGQGGNIGLSYGEDGNILVDDQYAPLTPKILAAIRTLDPDPVRFVINTHWHSDHSGGNENLARQGAVIIAHENARVRMAAGQLIPFLNMNVPPSPKAALPVVTFDYSVTLNINGDRIRAIHALNAHTDGDSLVYWEKANVLHMGDTFFHKATFPFIDLSSGGSINGLIHSVNQALRIANETTKIIPGHGPVATRQELVAYRDMLVDIRDEVARGIRKKRSLAEIKASAPAA
ncbi:MAG: MBL fold metallo-hydrolase, partial [Allosphingosinicella sp.]